jgi:phage repressor protein C with HTH and peptisase S24 domain
MLPTISKSSAVLINRDIKTFGENGVYLVKLSNKMMLRRLQEIEDDILIQTDNKLYSNQQTELKNIEIIGKAFHTFNSNTL